MECGEERKIGMGEEHRCSEDLPSIFFLINSFLFQINPNYSPNHPKLANINVFVYKRRRVMSTITQ